MQRTASPPHFCCTADDQRVWYGSKSTIGISLGAGTGSNALPNGEAKIGALAHSAYCRSRFFSTSALSRTEALLVYWHEFNPNDRALPRNPVVHSGEVLAIDFCSSKHEMIAGAHVD